VYLFVHGHIFAAVVAVIFVVIAFVQAAVYAPRLLRLSAARRASARKVPGADCLRRNGWQEPTGTGAAAAEGGDVALQGGTTALSTAVPLVGSPLLDLWAEPELHTALAEVNHGAGHIRVAVLVDAHGVVPRDAEDSATP
jgi:hypothetical protein